MIRWPALAICVVLQAAPPAVVLPEAVVQKQVEAYNAHDLDAFVACYAPAVEFRAMDGTIGQEKGQTALRKGYSDLFGQFPKLKIRILKRITQGAFVIDQQEAEGMGLKSITVTAIYEVSGGKIIRVWFIEG